jgi:hypothetical protein
MAAVEWGHGAQTTELLREAVDETEIGSPLRVAPRPAQAEKSSCRYGSYTTAPVGTPKLAMPMETTDSGMPETKFVVPSRGSMIHAHSAAPSAAAAATAAGQPGSTLSSPRRVCPGK